MIFLAEITVYNPQTLALGKLYFASQAIAPFDSIDADRPDQYYQPRITHIAAFTSSMFGSGRTSGSSANGGGGITISNADGALDYMMGWGFSGRPIALYVGDREGAFNSFQKVLTGTVDQPVFSYGIRSEATVTFNLRDKTKLVDVPIQNNLYLGTNSGAIGFEGLPNDIQGKPKPLCFGICYNVTPVLVNSSTLTYQVHDGAIEDIVTVYDKGVVITGYTKDLANGRFTLTAAPAGQITCDVKGAKPVVYYNRVGDLVSLIASSYAMLAVDITSIAALNSASGAEVGIYISDKTTIASVLDELLGSVRGYWVIDELDTFVVGKISLNVAIRAYFTDIDLVELNTIVASDEQGNIPSYQVELSYGKNYTVQTDADLAASVSADRRAMLAREYKTVIKTVPSVKTTHLLSPIIRRNTLLLSLYNTEATALSVLYSVSRQFLRIAVPFTQVNAALRLGNAINVTTGRIGLDLGKKFVITSISHYAPELNLIEFEVWG